ICHPSTDYNQPGRTDVKTLAMSFVNHLQLIGAFAFVLFTAVFIIWYTGRKLASRNFSDIRIVWYLFSLTLTVTLLIACWASSAGAIDGAGSFQGAAGAVLLKLLKSTLDLETAFIVYGGVVALIVFPQFASWVLSGLHGCASTPILVGPAFRFFFWSVVKSLVVVAGVILTTGVYGWLIGWEGMTARQTTVHACIALMSLVVAFALLYVYRDPDDALAPTSNPSPRAAKLCNFILQINAWMNRRITPPAESTPQKPSYTMSASFIMQPEGQMGQWKLSAKYRWP
ncbi:MULTISPECIES: hypothetical protein, partial [unclassified Variovorax]